MRKAVIPTVGLVTALTTFAMAHFAEKYGWHLDLIVGSLGTIVGAIGLVIGGYFGILAVDAFSHIKVLKDSTDRATAAVGEIGERRQVLEKLTGQVGSASDSVYSVGDHLFGALQTFLVSLPKARDVKQKDRYEDLSNNIIIERARFSLTNPRLDGRQFQSHVLTLIDKGDGDDFKRLQHLLTDSSVEPDKVDFLKSCIGAMKVRVGA